MENFSDVLIVTLKECFLPIIAFKTAKSEVKDKEKAIKKLCRTDTKIENIFILSFPNKQKYKSDKNIGKIPKIVKTNKGQVIKNFKFKIA